ncbi:MAG: outer membrane lipoprotein-sorting protein [Terriglobales bacterium]
MNPGLKLGWCRQLSWGLAFVVSVLVASAQTPNSDELQRVLSQMDQTAANFTTAQAAFEWDQYQKVVDEHDFQKGMVYFRRVGNEVQMAADISDPKPPKYVLFTDSKVEVYQSKIDQVTTYDTGKDRATIESFLVLGFGGSGKDMLKSFDVSYLGSEKVDGIETAKLGLVPKSVKVRNTFDHIWLWIDPSRGVSVQQQLFEPSGDYRLAKYSGIQLHQKIADSVFKLKITGKTKFVSPQG